MRRCRALLKVLDPDRPPAFVKPREFHWQYRALRERAYRYSQLLDQHREASEVTSYALERAEAAVHLSLQYFEDVLLPKSDNDEAPVRKSDG